MSAIKIRSIVLMLFLLFSSQLMSQQNNADTRFELYRFSEAIPLYRQVWDKTEGKQRSVAAGRLGDCYRLIGRPDSAAYWYGQASSIEGSDVLNYFQHAQSLRGLGLYEQARQVFDTYAALAPADERGKLFSGYCTLIQEDWQNLAPRYEVSVVEGLNTECSDFSPVAYKGGILFSSDRATGDQQKMYKWTGRDFMNMFYCDLQRKDTTWKVTGEPRLEIRFNDTQYNYGPASVSGDSLMYFTRTLKDRSPVSERKIRTYVLKIYWFDMKSAGEISFQPFNLNSETYSVAHPVLNKNSDRLYFSSDMPGGYGGMDLYFARKGKSGWESPVNLGSGVNTPGNEVFPSLYNDSALYFSSDYHPGYGGLDIFVTHPDGSSWTVAENMQQPLNSPSDDFGIMFTGKGTATDDTAGQEGLFSSSRTGGKGFDDIYAFRLKPLKKPVIRQYVRGYVKDRQDMSPIAGSTVFLLDSATMQVQVLTTDQAGMYQAEIHTPCSLVAKATKAMYIEDCMSFGYARQDTSGVFDAPRDLLLDRLEINKVVVLDNIYYDFDKWDIRPDARPDLDWLVRIMNDHPISVELGSHTDSRGSFKYNEKLSQRRAESAVNYIVGRGIESSRVTAKGYGEYQLTNRCADGVKCTPEEHQANRRTEFKVLGVITQPDQEQEPAVSYTAGTVLQMDELPGSFFSSCLSRTAASMPLAKRTETLQAEKNKTPRYHTPLASADCYAVEIMVSNSLIDLNDPIWRGIAEKNWYFDGQNYHYLAGCFKAKAQAEQLNKRMKSIGFNQATIVKLTSEGVKLQE